MASKPERLSKAHIGQIDTAEMEIDRKFIEKKKECGGQENSDQATNPNLTCHDYIHTGQARTNSNDGCWPKEEQYI